MNKIVILILFALFLTACQKTKDAFTLKKKSSADEFLVEKKSPLVLPPAYGELPLPGENKTNNSELKEEKEITSLITDSEKSLSTKVGKNSKSTSIEKSILEKIK